MQIGKVGLRGMEFKIDSVLKDFLQRLIAYYC